MSPSIQNINTSVVLRDFTLTSYVKVTYEITISIIPDSHKLIEKKKEKKNITTTTKKTTQPHSSEEIQSCCLFLHFKQM